MNYRDKYNAIVEIIETNIDKEYREIGLIASKSLGINSRNIYDIFSFISGYTFADYIGLRRLALAFEYKKTMKCSWENATVKYGEEYNTWQRKFKRTYGVTPTDALQGNNIIEFIDVLTIDKLDDVSLGGNNIMNTETMNIDDGILTMMQFKTYEELMTYKSLFGFSNDEILYIANISRKYNIDIEQLCIYNQEYKKFRSTLPTEMQEEYNYKYNEKKLKIACTLQEDNGYSVMDNYRCLINGTHEKLVTYELRHNLIDSDMYSLYSNLKRSKNSIQQVSREALRFYFIKANEYEFCGNFMEFSEIKRVLRAAKKRNIDILSMMEQVEDFQDQYLEILMGEYIENESDADNFVDNVLFLIEEQKKLYEELLLRINPITGEDKFEQPDNIADSYFDSREDWNWRVD